MKHNWIMNVLTDVKKYAAQNNLPKLAEATDDAILVAACEIFSPQNHVGVSACAIVQQPEDGLVQQERACRHWGGNVIPITSSCQRN